MNEPRLRLVAGAILVDNHAGPECHDEGDRMSIDEAPPAGGRRSDNPFRAPSAPLAPSAAAIDERPPLSKDTGFAAMVVTQFLGAFNDNVFKRMVLLLCLDMTLREKAADYQPIALFLFALPFVLFSGFAGFLADRYSKKTIFVLCKFAEIVVMGLGVTAFWFGGLSPALFVLFLMGTHSAFFGPAKYGILPEMLREADLPPANGVVQMTTFGAIIFGTALGGFLKELFQGELWKANIACVLIAVIGTIASFWVRRTRIARPDLTFRPSMLIMSGDTARLLWERRSLLWVLFIYAYFWFVCGLVEPIVGAFGKLELGLGDFQTSLLPTAISVGIGVGCAVAGWLSRGQVSFGLVRTGAVAITVLLAALSLVGWAELPQKLAMGSTMAILSLLGIGAGFMAVPLQVYIQVDPPADRKGQIVAAMNLTTWMGILLSAATFFAVDAVRLHAEGARHWLFLVPAVLMAPVALFYHPADKPLVER